MAAERVREEEEPGPGRDLLRTLEDILHLPAPTD